MTAKWKRSSLLSKVKGVSHESNKFFFDETNLDTEVKLFLDGFTLVFDDEKWSLDQRDERLEEAEREIQKLKFEKLVLIEMLAKARVQLGNTIEESVKSQN